MSLHSLKNIEESRQKVEAVKDLLGGLLDFASPGAWDMGRIKETLEENEVKIEKLEKELKSAERVLSRNDLEGAFKAEKVLDEA